MAERPVVAQKGPFVLHMEPGSYSWCACGKSKTQPFCDGSHAGSGIRPIRVEITEAKEVWWCGCKQSGGKPYCDDTHETLD